MTQQEAISALIALHMERTEISNQIEQAKKQILSLERRKNETRIEFKNAANALISPRFPSGTAQHVLWNGAEFTVIHQGNEIYVFPLVEMTDDDPELDPFIALDDETSDS